MLLLVLLLLLLGAAVLAKGDRSTVVVAAATDEMSPDFLSEMTGPGPLPPDLATFAELACTQWHIEQDWLCCILYKLCEN